MLHLLHRLLGIYFGAWKQCRMGHTARTGGTKPYSAPCFFAAGILWGQEPHGTGDSSCSLEGQAERCLTPPRQLMPGKVMCDIGTSLLVSLQQGVHAHMFPGTCAEPGGAAFPGKVPLLPGYPAAERRACNYFLCSCPANVCLEKMQQQRKLHP